MRTPAIVVLSLMLAASIAVAQAQGASGAGPSVAPGEPEIVLPQQILQIEDLSVEKVEAQLPPGDELLPPERKIPVLDEGDLAISEPALPAAGVVTEAPGTPATWLRTLYWPRSRRVASLSPSPFKVMRHTGRLDASNFSTTGGRVPGGRRRRLAIARFAKLVTAESGSTPG